MNEELGVRNEELNHPNRRDARLMRPLGEE